jgi:hypothetical protein
MFFSYAAYTTLYSNLSDLERNAVDKARVYYGLEADENPDNKKIENIYTFVKDPFDEKSGFLKKLNSLHVNTKNNILLRQIFIQSGHSYDANLILDSEIALRRLILVRSMAVIVPMKAHNPGTVHLLVVTHDIMSLQPSFDFSASTFNLKDLSLSLSFGEHNIFGYNKAFEAMYELKQGTHTMRSRYFDPDLWGSALEFSLKPSIIFSRPDFSLTGFGAECSLNKPLLSMSQQWGYSFEAHGGTKPIIDFSGDHIRLYKNIERRYRFTYGGTKIGLRRSFGSVFKKELFASYNLAIKDPSIPDDLIIQEDMREEFINKVLPLKELESYIKIGAAYFENRYLTLYNYDNFKLQEVKSLGISVRLAQDFAAKPLLLSDHNFLRPHYVLGFTQNFGSDAFMSLMASGSHRLSNYKWRDNNLKFNLTLVSPSFFSWGRFLAEGTLSLILDNRDNQHTTLGSDSGLRGVASRYYIGTKSFKTNVELRSSPLSLWILYTGFVLFYDAGAAFDDFNSAHATHSIGVGLRILAPPLSSHVFRLDFGFPLYGRGAREHTIVPSMALGQAF